MKGKATKQEQEQAARLRYVNAILAHDFIRHSDTRDGSPVLHDAAWRVRDELQAARRHWRNMCKRSACEARAFERATLGAIHGEVAA